jgi:hypothetical protein
MSTYRIKKRRRSHVGPILLIAAGLLLILLMIWQLSIKAAAMPSALAPAVSTEVIRVELEEARTAVERGEAVFIDVRDEELFRQRAYHGCAQHSSRCTPDQPFSIRSRSMVHPLLHLTC